MTSFGGPDVVRDWVLGGVAVAVAAPLAGAALAAAGFAGRASRALAVTGAVVALGATVVVATAWQAGDGTPVGWGDALGGGRLVFIDGLNAVLMPYAALLATAIALVAPRRTLDGPAARVFAFYMTAALVCMVAGTCMLVADPPWERSSGPLGATGGWLVAVAVMIRKGIFPFHSWYPALFSGAPMSTALMATQPQVAAYTAVRLLVGHAAGVGPELEMLSLLALVTAVYGAALAVAQRDLRGFIGAFAMSQSALVLAGLAGTLPMELDGAFCVWISSGLAITGIGLVSWAIESRAGAISLETLQGRFWDAPALAAFFLLFGMASIGLPGTLSFVADDLIVSGSLDDHVGAGLMVIASTVLCGIAVMRAWFHVFGGTPGVDAPRHAILPREQAPFTALVAALFALGIWPGPLVQTLERAAQGVLRGGRATAPPDPAPQTDHGFRSLVPVLPAPSAP